MIALLTALGPFLAKLALLGIEGLGYISRVQMERAGAAISQNEAQNEENVRINAAADAGAAAELLPIDTAASDPDNTARK